MRSPVRVVIGELGQAASRVIQKPVVIDDEQKKYDWLLSELPDLLDRGQLLIFCGTQTRVENLAHLLDEDLARLNGTSAPGSTSADSRSSTSNFEPLRHAAMLHGAMDQTSRMKELAKFSRGSSRVLVATDVASRGLDVPAVASVVCYDAARDEATHIHRIGRTGRLGGAKGGVAIALVTPKENKMAAHIVETMEGNDQNPPQELIDLAMTFGPYRSAQLAGMKMELTHRKKHHTGTSGARGTSGGLGFAASARRASTDSNAGGFVCSRVELKSHLQSRASSDPSSGCEAPSLGNVSNKRARWDTSSRSPHAPPSSQATSPEGLVADAPSQFGKTLEGNVINALDDLPSSDDENPQALPCPVVSKDSLLNLAKRRQRQDEWRNSLGIGGQLAPRSNTNHILPPDAVTAAATAVAARLASRSQATNPPTDPSTTQPPGARNRWDEKK
eukprot:GHVT01041929.1.p2 GENE.GHVT01041929.1~~GHVT01041929.1.p2  ORF type:complete len:446 (+),score=31.31 GHVT01041929.1:3908-5245(+)